MYGDIFSLKDMINFQNILKNNNQTVTTAESCTGGLISSMITEISGSSRIFRGSVVTYSNEVKEQELNVNKNTMIEFGVVSCEVVEEMLLGVLKKFDSDFAIAVSGVAGPDGGTESKPVGTICFAWHRRNEGGSTAHICFEGDRLRIREQACMLAMQGLLDMLQKISE